MSPLQPPAGTKGPCARAWGSCWGQVGTATGSWRGTPGWASTREGLHCKGGRDEPRCGINWQLGPHLLPPPHKCWEWGGKGAASWWLRGGREGKGCRMGTAGTPKPHNGASVRGPPHRGRGAGCLEEGRGDGDTPVPHSEPPQGPEGRQNPPQQPPQCPHPARRRPSRPSNRARFITRSRVRGARKRRCRGGSSGYCCKALGRGCLPAPRGPSPTARLETPPFPSPEEKVRTEKRKEGAHGGWGVRGPPVPCHGAGGAPSSVLT